MYAFCQDMPGLTLEQQGRLTPLIPDEALTGCVVHVVGEIEGGVRMVDVWTDEASYRTFQTRYLWPALDRLTAEMMAAGEPVSEPSPFTVLDVTGEGISAANWDASRR